MADPVVKPVDVDVLIGKAREKLLQEFGAGSEMVAGIAPGRVSLMGGHTDYNKGLVLPMTLPLYTVVVGRKRPKSADSTTVITLSDSCDKPNKVDLDLNKLEPGFPK